MSADNGVSMITGELAIMLNRGVGAIGAGIFDALINVGVRNELGNFDADTAGRFRIYGACPARCRSAQ